MVPDLIWAPKNMGTRMKIIIWHFNAGTNFLGDKNSRRPKKSWAKVRLGTISITTLSFPSPEQFTLLRFQKLHTVWLRVDLFFIQVQQTINHNLKADIWNCQKIGLNFFYLCQMFLSKYMIFFLSFLALGTLFIRRCAFTWPCFCQGAIFERSSFTHAHFITWKTKYHLWGDARYHSYIT